MSRYESSLISKFQETRDEHLRSILLLRLASYWARKGNLSKAKTTIGEVRELQRGTESAQMFAHINFAEAMCEFFEEGISKALPKLSRSEVLSVACPMEDDLPSLISVWSANFNRSMGAWSRVESYLVAALSNRSRLTEEVCCRLALVIGDGFQETEEYFQADRWYRLAREHSMKIGDDTVVGAMLYNKSAIRVFNVRVSEITDGATDLISCDLALQAASAENYSLLSHDSSMPWTFDLLLGQVDLLRGSFANALRRLDSNAVGGLASQWPAVEIVRRADVLRGRVGAGLIEPSELIGAASDLEKLFTKVDYYGDVAVAAYSLSVALGRVDSVNSMRLRKLSLDALNIFRTENSRELQILNGVARLAESTLGLPS